MFSETVLVVIWVFSCSEYVWLGNHIKAQYEKNILRPCVCVCVRERERERERKRAHG